MTEPGDTGAASGDRGRMRAAHADRERMVEVLKAAFVQGRLDKDELDTRVGQAFASRTYAELAAVTADIPAEPAPRQLPRMQNRTSPGRPIRNGFILSGASLSIAAVAVLSAFILPEAASGLIMLAAFIIIAVVPAIMMTAVATAWDQRRSRSRGQLPSRPRQGSQGPEVRQPGRVGPDPALPGDRPDQTRADLRSDSSRPGRPYASGWGALKPSV
jgi:hypothetical protein